MDRSSGKRSAGDVVTPRKAYSVTPFKDAASESGQNSRSCNRIGCSGKSKCSQGARNGNSDKSNCSNPSSNGNETKGKSSRSGSMITSAKRSCIDSKGKMSSQVKSDHFKSDSESPTVVSSSSKTKSSGVSSSNAGPLKSIHHKSNQNTSPSASVASVSSSSGAGKYSRNKDESAVKNMMKKRSLERECSSSSQTGEKIATPSPTNGISISSSTHSTSSSGEDICPFWTRRSMNLNTRMRLSGRRNSSSVREPPNYSQIQDYERTFGGSTSNPLSSNDDNLSSRMPSTNHDVVHLHDMDDIVGVLLALDRFEHDEELTREQFRELETSLFLSGLNLYDQHRQMRLDIDNMSYEELLALEDRMGTVSTALSEDAVSKCLKKSIHNSIQSNVQTSEDGDDIKCCICQEEYVNGDNIGKLVECEHGYHISCINQWLKVKNWCPICRASAAPSES